MPALDALRGQCACGAVRVTITPPTEVRDEDGFCAITLDGGSWQALYGHCSCRSCTLSGGAVMATEICVPRRCVVWEGEQHMASYRTSERVAYRFCDTCYSKLAYDADLQNDINVNFGLFLGDEATNAAISEHLRSANVSTGAEDKRELVVARGGRAGGFAAYVKPPTSFDPPAPGQGDTMRFECLCGDIVIEAPCSNVNDHCSCASCCRSSGGLVWSVIKTQAPSLPSNLAVVGKRSFCRRCATFILFTESNGRHNLALAALTDFTLFQPEASEYIFLGDQSGLRLPDSDGDSLFGVLSDDGQPKYMANSGTALWTRS